MKGLQQDLSRYKYKAVAITGLATFLGTLDSSIVNVSLPTIGQELKASIDVVGWVILAYAIAVVSLLMIFGAVTEKKGYYFSYTYGFATFIIGSALCGISLDIYFLIAARALQGIGASLLISVGPALITRSFPASERGKGLGILAMTVAVGLMLGPPLGGFIVSLLGWRWIFYVNFPVGIVGIYLTGKFIRDFPATDPARKISLPGAATLLLGLFIMMISLSFYSGHHIGTETLIVLLIIAAAAFGWFVYFENNPQTRLIGFEIFRNRIFTFSITALFLIFICISGVSVLMPFYLQKIKNFPPQKVGLTLMIVPVCSFFAAPIAGYLADKVQARIISTAGAAMVFIGVVLIRTLNTSSTLTYILASLALIGFGTGTFGTPNTSSIMGASPGHRLGTASGILSTVRTLGLTFGVGIAVAIQSFFQNAYLKSKADEVAAFLYGFEFAYDFAIVIIVAAMVMSLVRGRNLASNVAGPDS